MRGSGVTRSVWIGAWGMRDERPKGAARSLRQAVPARAGRDGRAGCRHAGEILRGDTGQRGMSGSLSLSLVWRFFIFNFLNPRFIRANSSITSLKQNPTIPSIQPEVVSTSNTADLNKKPCVERWRAYLTVSR